VSTPHISCDGRWRHSLQCSLHTQYTTSVYYEFTPLHAQHTQWILVIAFLFSSRKKTCPFPSSYTH
jgi:hypothetical protein